MSKILVVDDEIEICELLQIALDMHGHKVVISQSATHAMELMEEQEFDFVIIDMIMPEISGLEMIRIINDRYPKTLTILTTGLQTQDVIIEALRQGAYNFVNKPFSLDEINNIISAGSRAKSCHTQAKSIQPYLTQELHFVLPSQKNLMEEVAGTIAGLANWLGFPEKLVAMNIPLTVDELFLNAVIHGNKEDENKSVSIKVDLDDEKIAIIITDQGEGFDWKWVLDRNTPADLDNEGGRGIFLVKHYVDSIHYNEVGNEVRVTIRRDRIAPQSAMVKGNMSSRADSDVGHLIAIDDDHKDKDD